MVNPEEMLRAGCEILNPIMTRHGFRFIEGVSGQGSGGNFARGQYARDKRSLELHFRFSLGLVTYHLATAAVSHHAYMRELLGEAGGNKYPGVSNEPLSGFQNLAFDLENFADDFLVGTGEVLVRASQRESAQIGVRNKQDMARWVGDTGKRQEARSLFRAGNFQEVVDNLTSLTYPELLSESERKILEISRRKAGPLAGPISKLRDFFKRL